MVIHKSVMNAKQQYDYIKQLWQNSPKLKENESQYD